MNQRRISRNEFIKLSMLSLGALSFVGRKPVDVGVCTNWENSMALKNAGGAFIEEGVGKILMPTKSEQEFLSSYYAAKKIHPLPVRSFIYFLPGDMKAVGPDANHDAIVNYAAIAFRRAAITGARTVVFGSGRSREIPSGFDAAKAKEQMVTLCSALAPLAKKSNIILAVEQLNRGETNFLNTLDECAAIVNAVNHPGFKMVCDIFHALRENDGPDGIIRHKDHIVHCHIAEKEKRTPPGVAGDDFTPYFRALKKIRYKGGLSIECRWTDFDKEIGPAVQTLQDQYAR